MADTCNPLDLVTFLTKPSPDHHGYKVVEDLNLRYKVIQSERYAFGYRTFTDKYITYQDLEFHLAMLGLILIVRMAMLFIKSGTTFTATRKVDYLKKVLSLAWLRYMFILINQQKEANYEVEHNSFWDYFQFNNSFSWYVLMTCAVFESMNLLDMLNSTSIPFLSNSRELVQQVNGVSRYSHEEHEYINNFNFFDILSLCLNISFLWFTASAYLYKSPEELYFEEWSINFAFEVCILTMFMLLKPYETVRYHILTTFIIPLLVFSIYFKDYVAIFDNSFIDIVIFIESKMYVYLISFALFFVVKSYVICVLWNKEKVDDLERIEEEQRNLIEERRKMIEEEIKKHELRQALMIHETIDHNGGLQGFNNIKLFKDISW